MQSYFLYSLCFYLSILFHGGPILLLASALSLSLMFMFKGLPLSPVCPVCPVPGETATEVWIGSGSGLDRVTEMTRDGKGIWIASDPLESGSGLDRTLIHSLDRTLIHLGTTRLEPDLK